jgi:hypothetical protein
MNAKLKACRRCGGDLFPDRSDREGRTLTCLQCGAEITLSFRLADAPSPAMRAPQTHNYPAVALTR